MLGTGENEGLKDDMKKSSSRFQVARVDSQSDRRGSGEGCEKTDAETPGSGGPESPEGARFSISTDSLTYDTSSKTCGWGNTQEVIPHEDHYRNIFSATPGLKSRPTLAELHEENVEEDGRNKNREPLLGNANPEAADKSNPADGVKASPGVTVVKIKFGWIQGVLIRCLLNIWGVMLFVRLSWCLSHAGLACTVAIIILAGIVTTITSISMSAICTNGVVKGGGAYFMISRSLGPEFGGPIGIVFFIANACSVAMYVVGCSETAVEIMHTHGRGMVSFEHDVRIIGVIIVFALFCICLVGMEWEARAQKVLLAVLVVALINFAVGTFLPPSDEEYAKGFTGYSTVTMTENILPKFRDGENFASVFAVFFPAATGILAGANISGDLKDPQMAIPKGTLSAILISSIVYVVVSILLAAVFVREANGLLPQSIREMLPEVLTQIHSNATMYGVDTINSTTIALAANATAPVVTAPVINGTGFVYTRANMTNCSLVEGACQYGLYHDYEAMAIASAVPHIISAGVFSATLSSALASMVSAPKILQAVCKDEIFPKMEWFALLSGKNETPYRAYFLTLFMALAFTTIGDLNAIAPLISMFFLATYALINFACFDNSVANSPGWRPAFSYYNKWVSLIGFLICLVVMFLIQWLFALISVVIVASLFMYVKHAKPDVNWGSSGQAHVYRKVLKFSLKLMQTEDHIKNYRPQVLVLTGEPDNRPALVDFVSLVTKNIGLMVCGNVIIGQQPDYIRHINSPEPYRFLRNRKVRSFYNCTVSSTFRLGVQSMLQNLGIGKFKPNLLLMGFKCNWSTDNPELVYQYFNVVHDAFDLNYAVGIMRMKEGLGMGLDAQDATIFYDPKQATPPATDDELSDSEEREEDKKAATEEHPKVNGKNSNNGSSVRMRVKDTVVEIESPKAGQKNAVINTEVIQTVNRFNTKKAPSGMIDIWWLYDDGGLTLLIPYLLRQKAWKKSPIRILVPGTRTGDLDKVQRELVAMLQKFRLGAAHVDVVHEINKPPKEESMRTFNSYFKKWLLDEASGETQEQFPWKSTQAEVELLRDKTRRHVRLRELLQEKSMKAALIVMTLPMPRKNGCSAGLYMSWIDMLTRDMPPFLLLRGNQQSVLTFYS